MTPEPIESIKRICFEAAKPLNETATHGAKQSFSFEIDMSEMEDYNFVDIRNSTAHKSLFAKLKEVKGPVLYWFEIISQHDSHDVFEAFDQYRNSPNCKAVPALKRQLSHGTNVLYLGKVKTQFWGRFITHLGFFKTNATQGLQLFYWSKVMGLKLRVHVYEFNPNMAILMPIVENGMAAHLKPLFGKHK